MRIDGSLMGYGVDARCYLPIFPHRNDQTGTSAEMAFEKDSYYLGSHFMVDTTVIFDNSPFTEHRHKWAQIGLGQAPRQGSQEALLDTYVFKNQVGQTSEEDSSV